ncbi:thylakoid lumen 15.0 kDa protein [Prunus dulcis]|uniref:Thylakoid lumen 15.0 kDa protein n=1 Tax=Prunus dulcis TaxID=3755 RepID=A0A4Y1RQE9_PRUDU|nr:thylakoid lumen 15.0 kDa protein [Prunus dulcis]
MAFLHCSSPTSQTTSRLPFTPLITASSHLSSTQKPTQLSNWVSEFRSKSLSLVLSGLSRSDYLSQE